MKLEDLKKNVVAPSPWRYAPESDSDGFTIGTDHFVLDAEGDELAVAPNENTARLVAAAPDLLRVCREFLELWPLSGYELEAYCDSTLIPELIAILKTLPK